MKDINTVAGLKEKIRELEMQSSVYEGRMKEHWRATAESLRPRNLVKGALGDVVSAPNFASDLINAGVGLGVGFLTNKLLIGRKAGFLKRLMGRAIQFGVAAVVSKKLPNLKEKIQESLDHR